MEKFTKWCDKGSGINPFVNPTWSFSKQALPVRAVLAVLAVPRVLVVVLGAGVLWPVASLALSPLGIAAAAVMAAEGAGRVLLGGQGVAQIVSALMQGEMKLSNGAEQCWMLSVVVALLPLCLPSLRRRMQGVLDTVMVMMLFAVFGCATNANHVSRSRGQSICREFKTSKDAVGKHVNAGDLIVANHTSALELLYLHSLFSPVFVFVHLGGRGDSAVDKRDQDQTEEKKDEDEVRTVPCTLTAALMRHAWSETGYAGNHVPLADVLDQARRAGQPVVLFPEGARTNGAGVLQFLAAPFESLRGYEPVRGRIHLVAFSARNPQLHFTPARVSGSPWGHILAMCLQFGARIQLIYLEPQNVAGIPGEGDSAPKPKVMLRATAAGGATRPARNLEEWVTQLRGHVALMAGVAPVQLGVQDFRTFCRYRALLLAGKPAEAKKLSDARTK